MVFYPRDPTIRHAGRAHIRGKIRRIWRPRYLELCESGLVKYYELPPTADVTLPEDSDWDHVNMIPKDTLLIFHARIIDVTTLRDLHVGLPRGSFGFLFKGQRKCQDDEYIFYQSHHEPNLPREYFCAVSTLEEAQTWVVALQWAASASAELRRNDSDPDLVDVLRNCAVPPSSATTTLLPSPSPPKAVATTAVPPPPQQQQQQQQARQPTPPTPTPGTKSKTKPGKIVITKVRGYQLVKLPNKLEWEIAYEIAVLFLRSSPSSTSTSSSSTIPPPPRDFEERRLFKTSRELQQLFQQLAKESNNNNNSVPPIRSEPQSQPTFQQLLVRTSQRLPTLASTSSARQIRESLDAINQLLQVVAMEPSVMNSSRMKRSFVLGDNNYDHNNNKSSSSSSSSSKKKVLVSPPQHWWDTCPPKYTLTHRQVSTIPDTTSTNDFVKQWLSSTSSSSPHILEGLWVWALQRPNWWIGCAGIGVALLYPFYISQSIPSIHLRLDVLVASWGLAAVCGRNDYLPLTSGARKKQQKFTGISHSHSNHRRRKPTSRTSKSSLIVMDASVGTSVDTAASKTRPPSSVLEEVDDEVGLYSDDSVAEDDGEDILEDQPRPRKLSSPLPQYNSNHNTDDEASSWSALSTSQQRQQSCWSIPPDNTIFRVRGATYLQDRIKLPSGPSPFQCRGVDVWITDNPQRHIARHPDVLGGKLDDENTFLVNFLLPFGNFVSYFTIPPLEEFPDKLRLVWTKFLQGDQQYRDARLKLLPVVIDGPWIVKAAVGNGTAPALLGKVIPLQYFFREPSNKEKDGFRKGAYEVDVIITASSIAKGILSVVKGHTKSLTIAFAFIIEAATQEELPETVLCSFQVHALHLEDCPHLRDCNLDE